MMTIRIGDLEKAVETSDPFLEKAKEYVSKITGKMRARRESPYYLTRFKKEILSFAGMKENVQNPLFLKGLRFLSKCNFGFVADSKLYYQLGSGKDGSVIICGEPRRVRDLGVARSHDCQCLKYGIDVELQLDPPMPYGKFWDLVGSRTSSCDGSNSTLWELRTEPTQDMKGQFVQLDNVHTHVLKLLESLNSEKNVYLAAVMGGSSGKSKITRTKSAAGAHLHLHSHILNENLVPNLDVLCFLWNTHKQNISATKTRYKCSYGRLSDSRSMHDDVVRKCKRKNISLEYRSFTAPDFSNRANLDVFMSYLSCVDNVIRMKDKLETAITKHPSLKDVKNPTRELYLGAFNDIMGVTLT